MTAGNPGGGKEEDFPDMFCVFRRHDKLLSTKDWFLKCVVKVISQWTDTLALKLVSPTREQFEKRYQLDINKLADSVYIWHLESTTIFGFLDLVNWPPVKSCTLIGSYSAIPVKSTIDPQMAQRTINTLIFRFPQFIVT